jgi:sarcosine oxidase subunit gamma
MAESLQKSMHQPLAGRQLRLATGRGSIVAASAAARYLLRCKPGHAAPVCAAFGVVVPTTACTSSADGARAALWLGPDEWLLLADADAQEEIEAAVAALEGQDGFSWVDVGHQSLALEISGPAATDILSTGCPLDLGDDAFPPGACARTLFGKCEVVLWRSGQARYHMEFGRSYADYVWRLLEVACSDIGVSLP